ncbi:hypothetical protein L596_029630 [Steinernema carpocapsae]|uniref:Uncharacterized protein n=1 Tax=Steinernema carpocapsae TaxID=34508 RepID=A0A4U5LV78_STECR|nr:hypothetical protein L596_029630 [Steinernema carpocapsae]
MTSAYRKTTGTSRTRYTAMFGTMDTNGIFALIGDNDGRVIKALQNIQVITPYPISSKPAVPKPSPDGQQPNNNPPKLEKNAELINRFIGNVKNKYYQAPYCIYKMDKMDPALEWIAKPDANQHLIKAIAIVIKANEMAEVRTDVIALAVKSFDDAEKMLIVDVLNENTQHLNGWCVNNGFELIELEPVDIEGYEKLNEKYGYLRVNDKLETADWPNKMKMKVVKPAKTEFKPIEAPKPPEPVDEDDDFGCGDPNDPSLDIATQADFLPLMEFLYRDITYGDEVVKRDPCPYQDVKKALKQELGNREVYSLTNGVNKLHDNTHDIKVRTLQYGSNVVTSTAEIENRTMVTFTAASEMMTSAVTQSAKEKSSYSETVDSFDVKNGDTNADASVLVNPRVKSQKMKVIQCQTSTSVEPVTPTLPFDMIGMSDELKKWQSAQNEAESRTKPALRREWINQLEHGNADNLADKSVGVSSIIDAATQEASNLLVFPSYIGNVSELRDAILQQPRDQRANEAGNIAAAVLQSMTANSDAESEENGTSNGKDKDI